MVILQLQVKFGASPWLVYWNGLLRRNNFSYESRTGIADDCLIHNWKLNDRQQKGGVRNEKEIVVALKNQVSEMHLLLHFLIIEETVLPIGLGGLIMIQYGSDGAGQIIFNHRFHDKFLNPHSQRFFLGNIFIKTGAQNDRNIGLYIQ